MGAALGANTTSRTPGATLTLRTTVALPGYSTTAVIGGAGSAWAAVLRMAGNSRATTVIERMMGLLPG
jgi:hypothetical protein